MKLQELERERVREKTLIKKFKDRTEKCVYFYLNIKLATIKELVFRIKR